MYPPVCSGTIRGRPSSWESSQGEVGVGQHLPWEYGDHAKPSTHAVLSLIMGHYSKFLIIRRNFPSQCMTVEGLCRAKREPSVCQCRPEPIQIHVLIMIRSLCSFNSTRSSDLTHRAWVSRLALQRHALTAGVWDLTQFNKPHQICERKQEVKPSNKHYLEVSMTRTQWFIRRQNSQ